MAIVDFPQDFIQDFVDDQVLGVIGAGLSIRAGFPSWNGIMSEMIEECERHVVGFSEATDFRSMLELGKLQDVAEACRSTLGGHLYQRFLLKRLGDPKIRPTDVHRALLQLPFAGLLTTNFDTLLETAYNEGQLGRRVLPRVYHKDNLPFLSGSASERDFFILKLHGDVNDARTVVLAKSDYKRLMDPHEAYTKALSALLATKTLVFLGYSLQDDDIRNVLGEMASAFELHGRRHFAVMADPGSYLTRTLPREFNVHVIPYSAANQHAELLQLLQTLRASVLKHRTQFGPTLKESREERRFPYKFLDFYDVGDRDLFFGREDEVQQLAARVGAHRFLVVFGHSGAGKTSLLKAGLIPELEARGYRPAYCRFTDRDARETLEALVEESSGMEMTPVELANSLAARAAASAGLVVMLDQFEHAFTQSPEALTYLGEFLHALTGRGAARGTVLVCLREDYFVHLDRLTPYVPDVFNNRYRLGNMTEEQAGMAIREPARSVGLPCEEEFVKQVVEDLSVGGTVEAPQLQIICTAVFEALKSTGSGMSIEVYGRLGGARALIKNHIRLVLEDFVEEDREIARAALKSFISSAQTRTQLKFHHILSHASLNDPDRVRKVLEALISRRLVRAVRSHGEIAFELPHDYMIPHIDEWISRAEREQRWLRELIRYEGEVHRREGSLIPAERARRLAQEIGRIDFSEQDIELIQQSAAAAQSADEERLRLEQQFLQSHKMESIGRLAGGVAHDFNNLLTVMMGYGQMVLARIQQDDPNHSALEEILNAAERASRLTRQLLSFSRRSQFERELVDINSVLVSFRQLVSRLVGEDIEIDMRLCEEGFTLNADSGQLQQVLINLVLNAREAMPYGGLLIIECSAVAAEALPTGTDLDPRQSYLCVSVRDAGTGIPEHVREHLFEPFFTTKEGHRGLGLATAYGIVQQHGGVIEVESVVGTGSTFDVYLPQARVADDADESQDQAARAAVGTIVLVEDEKTILDLVSSWLVGAGYRVLTAAGGEQALRSLEDVTEPLATLVTDLVMPGMSGTELAARLTVRWPEMSICFISGYPEVLEQAKAAYPGARGLEKPFTAAQLLRLVRSSPHTGH